MSLFFGAFTQFFDNDGDPLSGAKLYFYDAGTTTPKDTYTTYTLGIANTNPVVADSDGRMGAIWLGTGSYKAVLKTSGDVTIWTADYVTGNQLDILTTRGDLLTRGASAYARLALGTSGYALLSNGSDAVWGAIPGLTVANTWTATQTIYSNDASASSGPVLGLYRDSASPAAADNIGRIIFAGEDSGGNYTQYADIYGVIVDPTDGSEDGALDFYAIKAGVETSELRVGNGVAGAGATGGVQGTGTANFTNYYKNGTLMAFQTSYDSGEQTITAAGALNLNHLLAAKPSAVTASLICKTAEAGFSIGDEVVTHVGPATSDRGFSCRITTAQLQIRYGSDANTFAINHATTGVVTNLTNANWRLRLRAFV